MEPAVLHSVPATPTENDAHDEIEVDELEEYESTMSVGSAKPKRPRAKPPTDRTPGMSLFPMSRVEAVVQADGGNGTLSKEAIFMLTIATEEFVKRLAQTAHGRSELDRRSMVHYRDVASTAYFFEEFQFLQDTVPMPIPLKEALAVRTAREQCGALGDITPTPSHSISAAASAPTLTQKSKGKSRARPPNGRPMDHINGKSTATTMTTDSSRDMKGRWAYSQDSISGSGPAFSMGGALGEGTSSLPNGSSPSANGNNTRTASGSGTKARSRPHRAWAPYLASSPVQAEVPVVHMNAHAHALNAVEGVRAAGSSPLWTRVPLPPPPSASVTSAHRTSHPPLLPVVGAPRGGQNDTGQFPAPPPVRSPNAAQSPARPHNSNQSSPTHFSGTHHMPPPVSPREPRPPPQDAASPGPGGEFYAQGQNPGRTIYSRQHRVDQ